MDDAWSLQRRSECVRERSEAASTGRLRGGVAGRRVRGRCGQTRAETVTTNMSSHMTGRTWRQKNVRGSMGRTRFKGQTAEGSRPGRDHLQQNLKK